MSKEFKPLTRRGLAKAITLCESRLQKHRLTAMSILKNIPIDTDNSIRVGISGPPGVGKTFTVEATSEYFKLPLYSVCTIQLS